MQGILNLIQEPQMTKKKTFYRPPNSQVCYVSIQTFLLQCKAKGVKWTKAAIKIIKGNVKLVA